MRGSQIIITTNNFKTHTNTAMRFDTTRFGQRTGKTLRRNPNGAGYVYHKSQQMNSERQEKVFNYTSQAAHQSQDSNEIELELDKRELIKKV